MFSLSLLPSKLNILSSWPPCACSYWVSNTSWLLVLPASDRAPGSNSHGMTHVEPKILTSSSRRLQVIPLECYPRILPRNDIKIIGNLWNLHFWNLEFYLHTHTGIHTHLFLSSHSPGFLQGQHQRVRDIIKTSFSFLQYSSHRADRCSPIIFSPIVSYLQLSELFYPTPHLQSENHSPWHCQLEAK